MNEAAIQLCVSVPVRNSLPDLPYTFQSNQLLIQIPKGTTKIFLAASATGDTPTTVDDLLRIVGPDGKELFKHDYSDSCSGKITPLYPLDVTDAFSSLIGSNQSQITVECTDLCGGNIYCSAIWLYYFF